MTESTRQATGPRTEAGKAKSSMNALKHGLSITRHVILEHEDAAEFQELCTEVHAIYEPQTARERLAVDDIAQCRWALRRFDRAEAFALEFPVRRHSEQQPEVPPQHKLGYMTVLSDQPGKAHSEFVGIHNIMRYRGHWDRRHQRALTEFDRAQRARYAAAREQRAQERHDLHCELSMARIARTLGKQVAQSPALPRAKTTIRIPAHIYDKFVSSDEQTPAPPPPPPSAESSSPEVAA